jgi:hypothetical protein
LRTNPEEIPRELTEAFDRAAASLSTMMDALRRATELMVEANDLRENLTGEKDGEMLRRTHAFNEFRKDVQASWSQRCAWLIGEAPAPWLVNLLDGLTPPSAPEEH